MYKYIVIEQRISDGLVLHCYGIKNSYDGALGRLFRCILNQYSLKNRIEQEDSGRDNSSDVIDSFVIDGKVRFFILCFDSETMNDL